MMLVTLPGTEGTEDNGATVLAPDGLMPSRLFSALSAAAPVAAVGVTVGFCGDEPCGWVCAVGLIPSRFLRVASACVTLDTAAAEPVAAAPGVCDAVVGFSICLGCCHAADCGRDCAATGS